MGKGASWAAVYGVPESQTGLKRLRAAAAAATVTANGNMMCLNRTYT